MNTMKVSLSPGSTRRGARWLLLLPVLVVMLNACVVVPLGYPAYGHGRYYYDGYYSHEGYHWRHDRY